MHSQDKIGMKVNLMVRESSTLIYIQFFITQNSSSQIHLSDAIMLKCVFRFRVAKLILDQHDFYRINFRLI
jgi:hypothetical protein